MPYLKQNADAIEAWRSEIESVLPNLLTEKDIGRMQRLLVRFIKLVPREYQNGVHNGELIIPLEYREATQFSDQAQTLVNQLAPVWKQEEPQAYQEYRHLLDHELAGLRSMLIHFASQEKIQNQADSIAKILENEFKISARRTGDVADVIDETALEVRTSLGNSLAAAKSDRWQEAESQRLDAYTAFDTEIEPRVLPRNPALGYASERSFIEGDGSNLGIKALLDSRAPMDQLEAAYSRTLQNLDRCMELLKVAVSPTTVGFTAFSIVGREGLEAVVILAALLAGLRGQGSCANPQRNLAWRLAGSVSHDHHVLVVAYGDPVVKPVRGKTRSNRFGARGDYPAYCHKLGLSPILLDRLECETAVSLEGSAECDIISLGEPGVAWGRIFDSLPRGI